MMVRVVFQLLESQYDSLLCACDFLFEQFRIGFYCSCSVGLLPDRIFQNYVAHGVITSTGPVRFRDAWISFYGTGMSSTVSFRLETYQALSSLPIAIAGAPFDR
jgi:hypothetical protein